MEPDGTLYITYLDTRDIRCGGAVALRQTLRIAPSDAYVEGIQRVVDAAALLLADALADHAQSEPVDSSTLEGLGAVPPVPETEVPDDDPSELDRNWASIEESRRKRSAD